MTLEKPLRPDQDATPSCAEPLVAETWRRTQSDSSWGAARESEAQSDSGVVGQPDVATNLGRSRSERLALCDVCRGSRRNAACVRAEAALRLASLRVVAGGGSRRVASFIVQTQMSRATLSSDRRVCDTSGDFVSLHRNGKRVRNESSQFGTQRHESDCEHVEHL